MDIKTLKPHCQIVMKSVVKASSMACCEFQIENRREVLLVLFGWFAAMRIGFVYNYTRKE